MHRRLHICPPLFTSWALCILAIFIIIFILGNNATKQGTPCDKTRQLFNSTWGVITDGPSGSNYTQDSHCEWLIKAKSDEQFITLRFQTMGTECSYDYVFVYDGDSFNSTLLGSFSGKTEPQQITAKSGSMLILLYSDTNYVLGGFRAEFSVTDCPRNCSSHGTCVAHTCVCEHNWGGDDCSIELCPDNCGSKWGRGVCREGQCVCSQAYSGQSCSLDLADSTGNNWHWLAHSNSGLSRRAAHTAVYIRETDSLYVFGGYDLNNILDDLAIYKFSSSRWEDENGNVLAGTLKSTNNLDAKTLASALRQLDVDDDQWGLKHKTFLRNILYSFADNSSWSNGMLRHHLSRDVREAEIEEDDIKNQNNPNGDYDKSSEKWDNYYTEKETTTVESFTSEAEKIKDINEESPFVDSTTDFVLPERPAPRYGHAASRYPGGFVIYGGKLSDGALSDELWFYDVTSKKWSLRAQYSKFRSPKLTRHTITLVGDKKLYLFGGSTIGGEFSSKLYLIELNSENPSQEQWRQIRPRGGKELDVRVVAHTTVYHERSDSLLVYGGVMAGLARFSKLSDRMFLFKLSNRHWAEIHYPRFHLREAYVPRERAFHTSTILGNYLVVFGGYSHRHNKEEICYDNQMYLYHLSCHTWVSHDILGSPDRGSRYRKQQGVFAHAADVRNGNTLLVVGGYHGNVNADLWAYTLPPMLASRDGEIFDPEQVCSRHHTLSECTSNPECGWCSADEVCYGRTVGINCTTNLQTRICPGVCPALGDCHSCLIHGERSSGLSSAAVSVADKLRLGQCTWCVQNARCHHKDDNYGVCGVREDTPSHSPGWWGSQGTEVTAVDECRTKDRRPGLTFVKYKHPANWSQPDSVSIINATTVDFDISIKDTRTEHSIGGGLMIARLLGFLRAPEFWANVTEVLKMCTSYSATVLRLSRSHLQSDLEVVGNASAENSICQNAEWPSGTPVRLNPGRYLVDFESKKPISSGSTTFQLSKMVLMHHKGPDSEKTFTFEYLEPYENGSCHLYSNCLHCLTDSLCGWCDANNLCLPRNINESQFCRTNDSDDWHYLSLQPFSCANCSNYISCDLCVSSNLCEWWVEDARCSRRGRAPSAITDISQCPVPCHLRRNCSACLDDKGRCVWCEATQECFSFSVYTSEYQFGLCREWVDQIYYTGYHQTNSLYGRNSASRGSDQCKSCSKHSNCSSCLHTLSCGWCYDKDYPIRGVCVAGDFNRPRTDSCSELIKSTYNVTSPVKTGWSYAQCPDVNECDLKLDNCHPEAICTNTDGSFTCECRRGFYGDGRRSCNKTCYNKCVHGVCTMAPDYRCKCDLGWTGDDCGIDCGCNNHSTCNTKLGVCDECQDWTTGANCQYCREGSYGNATTEEKCHKCECNGHGDESRGLCDSKTGICFCQHNTEGDQCERCRKDYYGDPTNGGICYYQCVARGMVTGLESQGIGSHRANMTPWESRLEGSVGRECLWILNSSHLANKSSQTSVIQLTIHNDINVKCQDNSVFVYDGLPDLVTSPSTHQTHALGAFCQRDDESPLTIETKSGTLTILYKQGEVSEGFNASYNIFSCPDNCPGNRTCIENECVCIEGYTGPNCSLSICSQNCSFNQKQGECDKGYGRCICKPGFGGSDCSVRIQPNQLIFTELFNSVRLSDNLDHLRKMIPRFGHSLVTDRRGSLWMIGGYSLSHGPLNDIRLFDTKNNTWMQVTVDSTRDASMPHGRYLHAAEIVHSRREIFVFGGIAAKDSFIAGLSNNTLRDFWKFSITHQRWNDIETAVTPPPLAGHTLTLMKESESENLVLIGGFSPQHGFLDTVWSFDLEKETWRTLNTSGNGPVGVCGHTTVYHGPTKSFYLFGGYMFSWNRTTYSKKLYALHFPTLTWSLLPTFEDYNPSNFPQPRFLHSAVTTAEYMLVFGGKLPRESRYLNEPPDSLIAYSYSCNQWIKLTHGLHVVGTPPPLTYGQAMTHDPETGAVYVVGGFDNVIRSHVTRINLPADLCNLWIGKEKCRSFLGCSFCSAAKPDNTFSNHCYSSSRSFAESCDYQNGTLITNNGVVCNSRWFERRSCEQFKTCSECLARWPTYWNEEPICKWCSNCSRNRCVPFNQTCGIEKKCDETTSEDECDDLTCAASDCEKCREMQTCTWSGSACVKRTTETPQLASCPQRCSEFRDCSSCLSSQCRWSTALKECVSPHYQPLYCAGGVCGLVLKEGKIEQCPEPCSSYTQCSTCLKNSHCGWCSINSNLTGQGTCTEGSLDKPLDGPDLETCEALLSEQGAIADNDSVAWNYVKCPMENECVNGHHTCEKKSEQCVDLAEGFRCVCGAGYKLVQNRCEPVCAQGCVRGVCTEPNVCFCDFGYVGANCSIQCQCNGHSDCAGPDKLDVCVQCRNNTQGAQCERCKPLFVGDPTNNGHCVPCFEYCNEHTNVCVNDSTSDFRFANKSMEEFVASLDEGPLSNALCVECANKTKGRRCDECAEGYFRGTEDLRFRCRPCECHGHGDRCDSVTGENCNCANNTESECQTSVVSKNSNQQCWKLQCSKCKDAYSGTPTEGHQCYRQITLDHKFCLDSKLIEECKMKPKPLYPGQSVFFQVQPRYVNVDIRVILDVTQGSLDLYMSPKDDSLVVLTNSSSGRHSLDWDPKYKKKPANFPTMEGNPPSSNGTFGDFYSEVFFGKEEEAEGLTTYITVDKKNMFLHVKNIRDRLILTLPKDKFDLISTRFYLALTASAQDEKFGPSYGILFFRQDQLHIDLFVFFSVFFSCFFLFLAGCVVAWKAKQAADMRRARRRHVVEMLHMAKRPFAGIVLQLETDETDESPNFLPQSPHRKKRKTNCHGGELRPVAIEPTDDGVAAIATVFVKLPGGADAPVRLSLASSLIMMSRVYPLNSRAFLRRRSSHHGPT